MSGFHFPIARVLRIPTVLLPLALAIVASSPLAAQAPAASPPEVDPFSELDEPASDEALAPEAPSLNRKPVAPRRIRFETGKFFAAWGTDAAEFDYDASGKVDCGDLALAAKGVQGLANSPARQGGVVPTGDAKAIRASGRSGPPSTIVHAWGTDAAAFDFDGDGTVGCSDVPGFITGGLKPRKSGPPSAEAPPVDDRSPSSPSNPTSSDKIPMTDPSTSGGAQDSDADAPAKVSPSKARRAIDGGGGRGGSGARGGGGGGGSGSASRAGGTDETGPVTTPGTSGNSGDQSGDQSGGTNGAGSGSGTGSGSGGGTDAGSGGGSDSGVGGGTGGGAGRGNGGRAGRGNGGGSGGRGGRGTGAGAGSGTGAGTGAGTGSGTGTGTGSGGGIIIGGGTGGTGGGSTDDDVRAGSGETLVRYEAGTPGQPDESRFSWVVTGVREKGTFVDGTPWITVQPGAMLVDLSPKSQRKRMTVGLEVWISGSAKNPRARLYVNPATGELVHNSKTNFDGREVRYRLPSQAEVDESFDLAANIGIVPAGERKIRPVPLVPGDVIVTADSDWVEQDNRRWGDNGGACPHTGPGRRTGIKRFGVLTVLREAPQQPSFRPPMQWIPGEEADRPAPIPLSRLRGDESALLHSTPTYRENPDVLLTGPTFRDGGGIAYQSSHALFALTTDLSRGSNVTYGGNLSKTVLGPALIQATNTSLPSDRRQRIRNRLIQYGIDCHGSLMSLVKTGAGAGQRAAEIKAWIFLAGWWLDERSMQNPYQAIRDRYPGSALAARTDSEIGNAFFHDDTVCRQVVGGIGLGANYIQAWGPGQTNRVQSASEVGSTKLNGYADVEGRFARLEFTGVELGGDDHARRPHNYYGMYVVVESGPGAGPTIYKVLRAGGRAHFADFIELDRPWQHGVPDGSSTVRMFPFRNGDVLPGDRSDVGRWYFSRESQRDKLGNDDLSPTNDGYAAVSAKSFIIPHAALKRLADTTGNRDYIRGSTWNWLSEVIGGSGTALSGERYGTCPDSDRILNLFWDRPDYLGGPAMPVIKQWIGFEDRPGGYGYRDLSRLPGARR